MKKLIILLLTVTISLFASTSFNELKFESGISIYGKIGSVDVTLEENLDTNRYKMQAIASSSGIVKTLTKNRKDIFISEGIIKDSVYIPTKFTIKISQTDYEKTTTYIFDYKKNTVLKTKKSIENIVDSRFDILKLKYIDTEKTVVKQSSKYIKLYNNDYLSLYLNMQKGNIKEGSVDYIDKKKKDSLFLISSKKVEVQKNHGDDKYNVELYHDNDSVFFQKIVSVGNLFYGDAYIEKVSEKKRIRD